MYEDMTILFISYFALHRMPSCNHLGIRYWKIGIYKHIYSRYIYLADLHWNDLNFPNVNYAFYFPYCISCNIFHLQHGSTQISSVQSPGSLMSNTEYCAREMILNASYFKSQWMYLSTSLEIGREIAHLFEYLKMCTSISYIIYIIFHIK